MSDPQQPPYAPQPDHPGSPHVQPDGAPARPGAPGYAQAGDPQLEYAQLEYAQPEYAQPGYAQPGYPQPGSLGRIAFIVAVITAALGLLFMLATPWVVTRMNGGYDGYQLFSLARSVLSLLLGALAIVLGIVAARRNSQPVLAGIAIGVGAVEVLGVVTSFLSSLMYFVL